MVQGQRLRWSRHLLPGVVWTCVLCKPWPTIPLRLPASALQIRGLARITLAPLVDTLPCLGAVQITLLEEPYIDFSISLFGSLDLMLLPVLKDAVNLAANKVCEPPRDPSLG